MHDICLNSPTPAIGHHGQLTARLVTDQLSMSLAWLQVVQDDFMADEDARSEALLASCLQAVLHATDATSARTAATLLASMTPPVAALKPLQLALQVICARH